MKPQAASWQGLPCMAKLGSCVRDVGVVQLVDPGAGSRLRFTGEPRGEGRRARCAEGVVVEKHPGHRLLSEGPDSHLGDPVSHLAAPALFHAKSPRASLYTQRLCREIIFLKP